MYFNQLKYSQKKIIKIMEAKIYKFINGTLFLLPIYYSHYFMNIDYFYIHF